MDRADRRLFFKFLNSRHHDDGVGDWFANRERLARWLTRERVAESGLIEVSTEDAELARSARDALNALIDDGEDARSTEAIDAIARELPLHVRFERGGTGAHLEPGATGIRGLTARVLSIAYEAMRDGTWDRLSHCSNDDCQWAFLDESKNRSRRWCDMRSCGTQAKSRSYRARQRQLRERASQ